MYTLTNGFETHDDPLADWEALYYKGLDPEAAVNEALSAHPDF